MKERERMEWTPEKLLLWCLMALAKMFSALVEISFLRKIYLFMSNRFLTFLFQFFKNFELVGLLVENLE